MLSFHPATSPHCYMNQSSLVAGSPVRADSAAPCSWCSLLCLPWCMLVWCSAGAWQCRGGGAMPPDAMALQTTLILLDCTTSATHRPLTRLASARHFASLEYRGEYMKILNSNHWNYRDTLYWIYCFKNLLNMVKLPSINIINSKYLNVN